MSWMARKLAGTDEYDQEQVIQEYLQQKEQTLLQEKLLAEFWKEYEEDERRA
jgi:hypothetical protein